MFHVITNTAITTLNTKTLNMTALTKHRITDIALYMW